MKNKLKQINLTVRMMFCISLLLCGNAESKNTIENKKVIIEETTPSVVTAPTSTELEKAKKTAKQFFLSFTIKKEMIKRLKLQKNQFESMNKAAIMVELNINDSVVVAPLANLVIVNIN